MLGGSEISSWPDEAGGSYTTTEPLCTTELTLSLGARKFEVDIIYNK